MESDEDENANSGTFSVLEPYMNPLNRKIIIIIITLGAIVFLFSKLLNVDSVILLNQPITNGKDPQLNNKYSTDVTPSSDGIQLPRRSIFPWWKYIISPNVWFNTLNKRASILKKKSENLEFTYNIWIKIFNACLLYTSDAADE